MFSLFLWALLVGYPVGAKIVTNMRKEGILTQAEAERLLAFTNNSGPLFIIGTVGISLFGNSTIGILLFITHLLACITVGFLFRFWKYQPSEEKHTTYVSSTNNKKTPQWDIFASSIMNSIHTIVLIGGFVVLFSVILSILQHSGVLPIVANLLAPLFRLFHINPNFTTPFISGLLELTNGVNGLTSITDKSMSIPIVLCAFLLGFAGISVLLQVYSIVATSDISIKPYILGKLLHGTLAAIYTYFMIQHLSIFNFDLEPVFSISSSSLHATSLSHFINLYNLLIFAMLSLLFLSLYHKHKKTKENDKLF